MSGGWLSLDEIVQMAAETTVIAQYGPEARIADMRIASIEHGTGIDVSTEDGVLIIQPAVITNVTAHVRLTADLTNIDITIKPIDESGEPTA
jgi:hypothetical protein